jgi:hypothetical protein
MLRLDEIHFFFLFYLKRAYEASGHEWVDAPYCSSDVPAPHAWLIVEQATLEFQTKSKRRLNFLYNKLFDNRVTIHRFIKVN